MKILFDDQIFRGQIYGGVSRYFYELGKRLNQFGNDVKIISPLYKCKYFQNDEIFKPIGFYDKINLLNYRLGNNLHNLITYYLIRKQVNIDIYHETSFFNRNDCHPNASIRVITVYDMTNEKLPHFFSYNDQTSFYKRNAVNRADHIICISYNTKKDLIDCFNIREEKISVVHLGYSIINVKKEFKTPAVSPFILYVGSRDSYKNFALFIKAFSHSCLNKELRIVCFGGGTFTKTEKELFHKQKIPDEKLVQISGDDILLSSLYSSAEAFVFPSLYEGFGLPLLEAMSLGCPVLCSMASSFPEVTGNAAEFFEPDSEDSIIEALEKVIFDEERKKSLVDAGFERVKRFSWDRCAAETETVYRKLLAKSSKNYLNK